MQMLLRRQTAYCIVYIPVASPKQQGYTVEKKGDGAHCNYFGPMTPGTEGLPAIFRFLKRPLIAFIEDTYVFCDIKQAKRAFIYKMQSLIFK